MSTPNSLLVALGILMLCGATVQGLGQPLPIPDSELSIILGKNGLSGAWHIDQLGYEKQGLHWQVDVFSQPQQIDTKICVANLVILDVDFTNGLYSVSGRNRARKVVALSNCDRVWSEDGNFVELTPGLQDNDLRAAVSFALSLSGDSKLGASVFFESDDLRSQLKEIRADELHSINSSDGHVALSFIVSGVSPNILVIEVDPRRCLSAYVYRESGPEIMRIAK